MFRQFEILQPRLQLHKRDLDDIDEFGGFSRAFLNGGNHFYFGRSQEPLSRPKRKNPHVDSIAGNYGLGHHTHTHTRATKPLLSTRLTAGYENSDNYGGTRSKEVELDRFKRKVPRDHNNESIAREDRGQPLETEQEQEQDAPRSDVEDQADPIVVDSKTEDYLGLLLSALQRRPLPERTVGDGDCLFHSFSPYSRVEEIAGQLKWKAPEWETERLRRDTASVMRQNYAKLRKHCTGTVPQTEELFTTSDEPSMTINNGSNEGGDDDDFYTDQRDANFNANQESRSRTAVKPDKSLFFLPDESGTLIISQDPWNSWCDEIEDPKGKAWPDMSAALALAISQKQNILFVQKRSSPRKRLGDEVETVMDYFTFQLHDAQDGTVRALTLPSHIQDLERILETQEQANNDLVVIYFDGANHFSRCPKL